IRLKPKEGRRARAGAPWIFSNEVQMDAATKALAPGTVVNVLFDDGQPVGTGYFNAKSLIAIRLLDRALDTVIGTGFFVRHIGRGLRLREGASPRPASRMSLPDANG